MNHTLFFGLLILCYASQVEGFAQNSSPDIFRIGTFFGKRHEEILNAKVFGRTILRHPMRGRYNVPTMRVYDERIRNSNPYVTEIGFNDDNRAVYFLIKKASLERGPRFNGLEVISQLQKVASGGSWSELEIDDVENAFVYEHKHESLILKFFAVLSANKRGLLIYSPTVSPNLGGDTEIGGLFAQFIDGTAVPITAAKGDPDSLAIILQKRPELAMSEIENVLDSIVSQEDSNILGVFDNQSLDILERMIRRSEGTTPADYRVIITSEWDAFDSNEEALLASLIVASTLEADEARSRAVQARLVYGSRIGVSAGASNLSPAEREIIESSPEGIAIKRLAESFGTWTE